MPTIGAWRSFDNEAVRSGDGAGVDHARSASRNLEEAVLDLGYMLPDKFLRGLQNAAKSGDPVSVAAAGVLLAGGGLLYDMVEAPLMAIAAVKDLADVAVHGIAAGFVD